MTEVVNIYEHERTDRDVYIGRGSKWGNPFYIGKDGTRKEVVEKYREYVRTRPDLIADIHELDGKVLTCYCRPQLCHGDVLLELLSEWKLFQSS